jgi:hypothetical protein
MRSKRQFYARTLGQHSCLVVRGQAIWLWWYSISHVTWFSGGEPRSTITIDSESDLLEHVARWGHCPLWTGSEWLPVDEHTPTRQLLDLNCAFVDYLMDLKDQEMGEQRRAAA